MTNKTFQILPGINGKGTPIHCVFTDWVDSFGRKSSHVERFEHLQEAQEWIDTSRCITPQQAARNEERSYRQALRRGAGSETSHYR